MKRILFFLLAYVAFIAQAQICYRIEGNGLKAPSYLFGTHHLAPLSVFGEYPGAKEGFANARKVVGEIDMALLSDMGTAMQMQQLALAPADSTLTTLIPEEKLVEYNKRLADLMPGVDLKMFDAFKPIIPANVITVTLISKNLPGYNPQEQLDTWFQQQGKLNEKEVIALETPLQQAEALYVKMPVRSQAKALVDMLENPDKLMKQIDELNKAYLSKDLDKLLKLSEEEQDEESRAFYKIILQDRNRDWLKKLPSIINDGPVFIAVGALHLPGKDGLIEGLRQAGYTVTPVE